MRSHLSRFFLILACVASWSANAANDTYEKFEAIPKQFRDYLQPTMARETYIKHMRRLLRQDDRTEVSAEGLEAERRHTLEKKKFMGLALKDANQDGNLTREEVGKSEHLCTSVYDADIDVTYRCMPPSEDEIESIMKSDFDHDGIISYKEMWTLGAEDLARPNRLRRFDDLAELLELDPNVDGTVTIAELEDLARKAFATADKDGNGVFTQEEYAAIKEPLKKMQAAERRERGQEMQKEDTACKFDKLPVPDNLLVYGAGSYSGRPIGRQIDHSGHDAGQIDLIVNVPDRPVALILGAYDPVIWNIRYTKETKIHSVIVGGHHGQVITGLPETVPTQINSLDDKKTPCGDFYFTTQKIDSLNRVARSAYGKDADMFFPAPQGKGIIGNENIDQSVLSPEAAPAAAATFALAGPGALEQAVKDGILRAATQEDQDAWLDAYAEKEKQSPTLDIPPVAGKSLRDYVPKIRQFPRIYVVLKDYTYPAGLYGGHSAIFIIPKGISLPKGEAGHSGIYDMNTLSCYGALAHQDGGGIDCSLRPPGNP